MHAIVLYHSAWGPTGELARVVAQELGCRAIDFEKRPELGMYQLVVLAAPVASVLDPRLVAFAGLELRGRTLAVLSDAGPFGEAVFWGITAAAMVGGCRIFTPSLHASTGWLADTHHRALEQARSWGKLLAGVFPPRQFPAGPAGKRVTN